jgi:hypothetical protein
LDEETVQRFLDEDPSFSKQRPLAKHEASNKGEVAFNALNAKFSASVLAVCSSNVGRGGDIESNRHMVSAVPGAKAIVCNAFTSFLSGWLGQTFLLHAGFSGMLEAYQQLQSLLQGTGRSTKDFYGQEYGVVLWSNLFTGFAGWTGIGLLFALCAWQGWSDPEHPARCRQSFEHIMMWGFCTFSLGALVEVLQVFLDLHQPGWTLSATFSPGGIGAHALGSATCFALLWWILLRREQYFLPVFLGLPSLMFSVLAGAQFQHDVTSLKGLQFLLVALVHGLTLLYTILPTSSLPTWNARSSLARS